MQHTSESKHAQHTTALDQFAQVEEYRALRNHGYQIRGDVGHTAIVRAQDGSVDVIATARAAGAFEAGEVERQERRAYTVE